MKFENVKFTKHALERMEEREVTKDMIYQAIHDPDKHYIEDDDDYKFIRNIQGERLHVVCKPLPEENAWLVKTTWFRDQEASEAYHRKARYEQYQQEQMLKEQQRLQKVKKREEWKAQQRLQRANQKGKSSTSLVELFLILALVMILIGLGLFIYINLSAR